MLKKYSYLDYFVIWSCCRPCLLIFTVVPFHDFEINYIGIGEEAKHAGRHLGL